MPQVPWWTSTQEESNHQEPQSGDEPQRRHRRLPHGTLCLRCETWLEWQAWQLGTSAWWMELKAILGIRDPQKLTWKIGAPFYIPKVRMRALLEPEYTAPPTPRSLNRNAFLPEELSYQDMWQQLVLLTIACNTGQKNEVCQKGRISVLWWEVSLNYGRQSEKCYV